MLRSNDLQPYYNYFALISEPSHTNNHFESCLDMSQIQFYNSIRELPGALFGIARSIVHPARPVILDIPLELLLHIVSYLPLQDHVCLALTCKALNEKLGSVFSASELGFPRMLSKESPSSPRITLLTQLEDDRWACCGGCQKLHPREEITRQEMCVPPKQRRCTRWCGIVDLCPCISLTPRDRSHLVNYLSEPAGSHKQWLPFLEKGLLRNSMSECGDEHLLHECHGYSTVQVVITLSLSPTKDDGLLSRARYETSSTRLVENMEPVHVCCHRGLFEYLENVLRSRPLRDCAGCRTYVVNKTNPSTPEWIIAEITRDLGRGTYPTDSESWLFDTVWLTHCRSVDWLYSGYRS